MMQLCRRCQGTGFYLGSGFMRTECELCNDENDYSPAQPSTPSLTSIDRRSKSYRKAIEDIMAVHPDISRGDAVKMFDEAYMKN